MQSVSVTTKVVGSNPARSEVYSIQHYVIKFVSDLWQICVFSQGTPHSFSNKTDRHEDKDEILLKVWLYIITQTNHKKAPWQHLTHKVLCKKTSTQFPNIMTSVGDMPNFRLICSSVNKYTRCADCGCPVYALCFMAPKTSNYLAFRPFDFEHTWCRFFQKRVVRTKFDIYVFIKNISCHVRFIGNFIWFSPHIFKRKCYS